MNQTRRVQDAGLTDLENQMEQADFAFHLINVEIAINSLVLKRKQQDEDVEIAKELNMQIYYTTKLPPSVFLLVSLR